MSESSHSPAARPSTERKLFVYLAILSACAMFVLMVGVLYYRWATSVEPTAVLVVDGTEALRGIEVTVSGMGLANPYRSVFGEGERFSIPFYLEPGTYTLHVKRDGEVVFQNEVVLQRNTWTQVNLKTLVLPPATQTTQTTRPAGASAS